MNGGSDLPRSTSCGARSGLQPGATLDCDPIRLSKNLSWPSTLDWTHFGFAMFEPFAYACGSVQKVVTGTQAPKACAGTLSACPRVEHARPLPCALDGTRSSMLDPDLSKWPISSGLCY